MVDQNDVKELLDVMKLTSDALTDLLIKKDAERKLLLFYSLSIMSDQYMGISEDAMKKGEDYETAYYANKAEEVRQATKEIFGAMPEKDYYHKLPFKIPRWYHGSVSPEQLVQLADFCVSNVQPDEEVLDDEKLLYGTLRDLFNSHRHAMHDTSGIELAYVAYMRERFKLLSDKPSKLTGIYEMMLLLDVIDETIDVLKNPSESYNIKGEEDQPEEEQAEDETAETPGPEDESGQ